MDYSENKNKVTLTEINNEYQKNKISERLCDLLEQFSFIVIDNANQDLFWNDSARNLLQLLIVCSLNNENEVTIKMLLDNINDIEKTKQIINENIDELNKYEVLKEVLSFTSVMLKFEKTFKSVVEVLNKKLLEY